MNRELSCSKTFEDFMGRKEIDRLWNLSDEEKDKVYESQFEGMGRLLAAATVLWISRRHSANPLPASRTLQAHFIRIWEGSAVATHIAFIQAGYLPGKCVAWPVELQQRLATETFEVAERNEVGMISFRNLKFEEMTALQRSRLIDRSGEIRSKQQQRILIQEEIAAREAGDEDEPEGW